MTPHNPALYTATNLQVGYAAEPVIDGIDLTLAEGRITALIGPNGCGKSTLLKALGRQLAPTGGRICLGGRDIREYSRRSFAREVAFLAQEPVTPEGVSVRDVISYGRYPYTGRFATMSSADHAAVEAAADSAGVGQLLDTPATDLSGGQRQRVWVAMALAQQTPVLLLDEPTTYLDPAHQVAILDLVSGLKATGRTVVMVLHDMTQAARFADDVVAMRDGRIVAAGPTEEVLTPELVRDVFGIECLSVTDPDTGRRLPVPYR
ncbi:ABC transporter ATP-binding protein [Corynebacterium liangguodongii]|uniref:Fe(3+)-dicitrate ABC transporter ATP-binding protein n=1 Tax=Corynebacterium liangguodongii TaxID=2079535 RepID=A0A2S0WF81_9CORY|nr:ABC transporter ATP-binding protein [Corynebacterium liangguodongii]AWB84428.1 Fe(3+)-dicitrate ABC transporter ATP-binding protein [Corynebacterium liangguodongii]PWB99918.1 ABC transporter ATP-binding protein [Corynebacterium liangguodongii]